MAILLRAWSVCALGIVEKHISRYWELISRDEDWLGEWSSLEEKRKSRFSTRHWWSLGNGDRDWGERSQQVARYSDRKGTAILVMDKREDLRPTYLLCCPISDLLRYWSLRECLLKLSSVITVWVGSRVERDVHKPLDRGTETQERPQKMVFYRAGHGNGGLNLE